MYLQQFEPYWSNRCVIDSDEEGIKEGQVLGMIMNEMEQNCKLSLQKARIGIDFVSNAYFAIDLQHAKLAVRYTEQLINSMRHQ